ncbi:hypothetical protein PAPYR_9987 [Paratrimastix pyriformis]|uniref:Uncharacterized protein n=1 Tax=Paratrimastix pyriformis TaxID=342808 RepID=A0ABQ8U8R3_9EUKA|nr:hypothetical protein PAPYR_9987 [Paratrimastix pyriformis]
MIRPLMIEDLRTSSGDQFEYFFEHDEVLPAPSIAIVNQIYGVDQVQQFSGDAQDPAAERGQGARPGAVWQVADAIHPNDNVLVMVPSVRRHGDVQDLVAKMEEMDLEKKHPELILQKLTEASTYKDLRSVLETFMQAGSRTRCG